MRSKLSVRFSPSKASLPFLPSIKSRGIPVVRSYFTSFSVIGVEKSMAGDEFISISQTLRASSIMKSYPSSVCELSRWTNHSWVDKIDIITASLI